MSYSNIFASKKTYSSAWEVVEVRRFSEEELLMIKSAEIIEGQYGRVAKCFMVGGGVQFHDLGKYSRGQVGDKINLEEARVITLEREGTQCIKIEL